MPLPSSLSRSDDRLFFAALFDRLPQGVLVYEAIRNEEGALIDYRARYVNARAVALTGYSAEQLGRESLFRLRPDLRRVAEPLRRLVEQQENSNIEYVDEPSARRFRLITQPFGDGFLTTIDTVGTPARPTPPDGEPTDLQQAQQRIAELERSNQQLERFAYVASHDLQEPLRKIQLFSAMLLDQFSRQLTDDGLDLLHRMRASANRMSALIQSLLSYARVSAGPRTIESVNLTTLFPDILADLETAIHEKNVQIVVGNLPTLPGNADQFRQLFQNLVGNAIKFSRANVVPQVFISATVVPGNQLPAPVFEQRVRIWHAIAVADNGIGFNDWQKDQLFELFERLHNRQQYAGTGIGLAVCRKIVENHGGTLTARGQPNQGATFTVYLPG